MEFVDWTNGLTNIAINAKIKEDLAKYYQLIIKYNKIMNLTRIVAIEEAYYKHFYDALLLTNEIKLTNETICDVGSGFGIPGIVLKIFFPTLNLTIIESNQKKCHFLKTVINELSLANVKIINDRAENAASYSRDCFDIVVARAVAPLNILHELCLPLVKVSGYFVAYKGPNVVNELKNANNSQKKLHAKLIKKACYELPKNFGNRILLIWQKTRSTNLKYPRSYQAIKKNPL